MGAATFAPLSPGSATADGYVNKVIDNKRVIKGMLTFSTSYATGGDSFALGQTGLREITDLLVIGNAAASFPSAGLSIALAGTKVAPLILAFDAANTEVPNATNLAARTVLVYLIGS